MLEIIVSDVIKGLGVLDKRHTKHPLQVWRNAKQSLEEVLGHLNDRSNESYITLRLRHHAFMDAQRDIAHIIYDFNNKWVVCVIVYNGEGAIITGCYFGRFQSDNVLVYMQEASVNNKQGLYMRYHYFDDPISAEPFDEQYLYSSNPSQYFELILSSTGYRTIGKDLGKTDISRS